MWSLWEFNRTGLELELPNSDLIFAEFYFHIWFTLRNTSKQLWSDDGDNSEFLFSFQMDIKSKGPQIPSWHFVLKSISQYLYISAVDSNSLYSYSLLIFAWIASCSTIIPTEIAEVIELKVWRHTCELYWKDVGMHCSKCWGALND